MKNPFDFFKHKKAKAPTAVEEASIPEIAEESAQEPPIEQSELEPEDDFTEWGRSQTHGGIERRERNDIYEAYNVYGTDSKGSLICRCYHRYPEHERDFDLSYSKALTFDEFNRRLLSELDRGDMKLNGYNRCIGMASGLKDDREHPANEAYTGFTEDEIKALNSFCEALDTFKDKSYINENGVYRCECESVAGGEVLNIRFRKPLIYDALDTDVPGVQKESIYGYDLDDIWIMSVYNRLNERCASCKLFKLAAMWSLNNETLYLIKSEGFDGLDGTLVTAVGKREEFARFGLYSLDFTNK